MKVGNIIVQPVRSEADSMLTELQSQRDTMSRLREESRKLRSEYDELQLRYDDEVYNGGSWKKDKERLETKIQDLTKAYDVSVAVQAEQQSQIVALHSQVHELHSVLNDAETDRTLLKKARCALQAELEAITRIAVMEGVKALTFALPDILRDKGDEDRCGQRIH